LLQPVDSVPEVAARNGLQPSLLPECVTPDWLKDNHHLMRADLRKLSSALAEEYSDWPAAVDGSDEGAFWRAVHSLAQRWAWFLWLFEERILELFGRVKGRKKLLGRLVLKSAAEREAGMMEQRIMPMVMQRTARSRQQSQDTLVELINLGSELRLSLLRCALADHTG